MPSKRASGYWWVSTPEGAPDIAYVPCTRWAPNALPRRARCGDTFSLDDPAIVWGPYLGKEPGDITSDAAKLGDYIEQVVAGLRHT